MPRSAPFMCAATSTGTTTTSETTTTATTTTGTTTTGAKVTDPGGHVTMTQLDRSLVASVGLGRAAKEFTQGARAAGLAPIKVNMVVKRGVNDHQVVDMARHFRGSGRIVRFIDGRVESDERNGKEAA